MERWSKIAEWFDLNREKITLVAGGIGVVFSLLGVRLGLPFDWAWFTIVLCGLPIVWGAAVAMYEEFDIKADLLVSLALKQLLLSVKYLRPQKLLSSCNWGPCSKSLPYLKRKQVSNVSLN